MVNMYHTIWHIIIHRGFTFIYIIVIIFLALVLTFVVIVALHISSACGYHLNTRSKYDLVLTSLPCFSSMLHCVPSDISSVISVRNWSAVFGKIGHFVAYWLLSHWKCTVHLADQNGFWSAKCWNWSKNGQWLAVISSTVYHYT